MSNPAPEFDFEEAFRLVRVDSDHCVGAHPLKLPIAGARGVYGGHLVAQSLYAAMESSDKLLYRPYAFHSYFLRPASPKLPMEFKVLRIDHTTDPDIIYRDIVASQKGRPTLTCRVSLIKKDCSFKPPLEQAKEDAEIGIRETESTFTNEEIDKNLHRVDHTTYISNAYLDEFVDYRKCPEEDKLDPSERSITVYSKMNQKEAIKDPNINFVALADLSDSAFLTTLARVLHVPWNLTEGTEDFDPSRDALDQLLAGLFNVLHLFHYNAMSMDHHIYFHADCNQLDVFSSWHKFKYHYKRLSNNRALVQGNFFDKKGNCMATVIQEGLVYMVPEMALRL